jgi:hypothetical protein
MNVVEKQPSVALTAAPQPAPTAPLRSSSHITLMVNTVPLPTIVPVPCGSVFCRLVYQVAIS